LKAQQYLRFVLTLLLLLPAPLAYAGTVTGQIQLASSGKGLANGTLTFTLSQAAVVSGTASIVTSPVSCYTDASGNVVGLPNPLTSPSLSPNSGSGSLPPRTYFVRYTWANTSGETVGSGEAVLTTTQNGTLIVQVPANPPANATQWKIYIGTASGGETLQATQTAPFTSYSQSVALVAGTALPAANTTVCSLRFNDELQPSYTAYTVTLITSTGANIPGFPQKWYLSGGAAGTVNVGQGSPLYNGTVVYPQPIISNPAQSSMQSLNGPLNMNGFAIINTALSFTNGLILPEAAAPPGSLGNDILYADQTAHRLKMINNNTTADLVIGANTADTLTQKNYQAVDGSAAAPSYSFGNATGTGLYNVSGTLAIATGGILRAFVNANMNLGADSAGYLLGAAQDTGIWRCAAASFCFGNGTAGSFSGIVKATTINAATGFQVNGTALAAANLSDGNSGTGAIAHVNGPAFGTATFSDVIFVSGNASLPTAAGGNCYWAGGYASPVAGRLICGDGTGWEFRIAKRSASTTTDLFNFFDSGIFNTANGYRLANAAPAGHTLRGNGTNYVDAQLAAGDLSDGVTGTGAIVKANSPTNVTLDAEGTGNNITIPVKLWFPAGGCQNATASGFWDWSTTNFPAAVCVTGTNIVKGVLRYTAQNQAAMFHYQVPADIKASGTVDIVLVWTTSTASGTAQFQVLSACTTEGATATDDPALTSLWAPASFTASATGSAINSGSVTGIAEPCTAGQIQHIQLKRVDAAGTALNADVIGIELTLRRTM
jgi:hypothetical protein